MKSFKSISAPGSSRRLFGAVLFTGLMGVAAATQAGPTVDLTFGSGLFPAGSKGTTIEYNNGTFSTGPKGVAAGMFSGVASNPTGGFELSSLYLSEGNVLAYCVDILQSLLTGSSGSTYHVNDVAQDLVVDDGGVRRDFGRTLQFLGAANQVAQGWAAGPRLSDKNWLNPTYNWMAAAIQVGIWESLYEESSSTLLSTDGGWFTASSIGTDGNKFLSDSFSLMHSNEPPLAVSANQVKWLVSEQGQDLLVDPVDVPAPAPLLLLLAGLALLLRRRV